MSQASTRATTKPSYGCLSFVTENELVGEGDRPTLAVDWWSVQPSSDFGDREPGRVFAREFLRWFQADTRTMLKHSDQPEIVLSWIVSAMLRKGQLGATERGFLEEVGQTLGRALVAMPTLREAKTHG